MSGLLKLANVFNPFGGATKTAIIVLSVLVAVMSIIIIALSVEVVQEKDKRRYCYERCPNGRMPKV